MSAKLLPNWRGPVTAAALLLLTGAVLSPALAQAPKTDLLDQVRRSNELVAQKLEAEVRDALAEAPKLIAANPAQASERLKAVLAAVEADRALTPARRDLLTRNLKDRLRAAETEHARRNPDAAPAKGPTPEARMREAEQRAAEAERVRQVLEQVYTLREQGKTADATKVAEELFRQHPELAAPQVIGRTSSVLEQIASLRGMEKDAIARRLVGLNNVEKSALSPGADVELPKNWHELVSRRAALTQANIPPKERQILSSLAKEYSVDYKNNGFTDVIEDLSTKLNQPILLDKNSLAEAQVTSDTQVTLQIKGITGRTALRKILGDVGLSYVIKDGVIQVVSEKTARETMVTRTYYLGSLLEGGPFSNAGIRFVPGLNQFEAMQNVQNIVQMIQGSVDPRSWQANGGPGAITFHAPSMSLVIRNTAEVHSMMGSWLK